MKTIRYFGYGSNMDATSLAAKGVRALGSRRATLPGWRLVFEIPSPFEREGTVADIVPDPSSVVHGIVHECDASSLSRMDALEGEGLAYERRPMRVRSHVGEPVDCFAYVGLPPYNGAEGPTSQRYLDILVRGASRMGLEPSYVDSLRRVPVLTPRARPRFRLPRVPHISERALATSDRFTALAGAVFDLRAAAPKWQAYLGGFAIGHDISTWILGRQPRSEGRETLEDVRTGRLHEWQVTALSDYLYELERLSRCVGLLPYARALPFGHRSARRPAEAISLVSTTA